MFSQLAKHSAQLLAKPAVSSTYAGATRCMSVEGVKSMQERESAAENLYFNKEDERLLRGLLGKMKSQADKHDVAADSHNTAEGKQLEGILAKYNVSEADFQALLKWKHS